MHFGYVWEDVKGGAMDRAAITTRRNRRDASGQGAPDHLMTDGPQGRIRVREWIEVNLDRLYGFAFSLTQDSDEARDLVQDCILRAIEAPRRPSQAAAYRAWLFRILRNAFIDRCRKAGVEVHIDAAAEIAADDDAGWAGDRRMVDVITIRIAVAKLPIAHREIIGLVDINGFSYAEAAEVLEIAEGTVMSRLSRARKALLNLIAEDNVTPLVPSDTSRGVRG
jgi:RNA polymerase sigma-70 factor (ECF subfamily)